MFTEQQRREAKARIVQRQALWDFADDEEPTLPIKLELVASMFDSMIVDPREALTEILMSLNESTRLQDSLREAAALLRGTDTVN